MGIIDKILYSLSISKRITEEDIIKIREADWDTCAKWWGTLNKWDWPSELLPEEKPEYTDFPKTRRGLLMSIIKDKCGEKYILRKLNVLRGMTEGQFEDFWRGTHEGDKESYRRYSEYVDNIKRDGGSI